MRLYDDCSQQVETFRPLGEAATIYVCGITPYDTTHLGHAFTYTSFDILIRYLELQGYPVRYTQNVTDIDDDILRKAGELGEDWRALGNRWTAHFIRDMIAMNVRPPDYYPRATDVIDGIVAAVSALLAAGVAYTAGGSVYFDVDRYPEYGHLSHIPRPEMLPIANERGNRPGDPLKRHPLDFILWQAQAPGEPTWPSPWGPGRPGWHIECSTMADRFLGSTIDIHGGGADLIFPHHESEIAQSVCATGQETFARYWLHTAMVRYEGEKMSKSLGNLVMVRDLLDNSCTPDALRLYLAGRHYRQVWGYHEAQLAEAERRAEALRSAALAAGGTGPELDAGAAEASFRAALDDDLNTPAGIETLARLAEDIRQAAEAGRDVRAAQATLHKLAGVLGLRLDATGPEPRVVSGWSEHLERFA
jgi:L-cysteine:1D-myo-inositol 2-amino-2-deoxy-alpha-D-glucopyranoside ligase